MVIRMNKRITGITYENGKVIGVTIDGLNDGTDKAYFKRELCGSWIIHIDPTTDLFANCKCSRCGDTAYDASDYCPNCGAKMD